MAFSKHADPFKAACDKFLDVLAREGGEGTSSFSSAAFAQLLNDTQMIATASVLCTIAEVAEFAGREGPDLLHGGIVSYYKTEAEAAFSYETSYRPLSLEPLSHGLFGALDEIVNSACDSDLVFAVHLWPLPWLQSCYLAAIQGASGGRDLLLIGPRNQHCFLPLEAEGDAVSNLTNVRTASFNHDTSSAVEALLMLSGMAVTDQSDWDLKLVSEHENVRAIRAAGNDLFADLWSSARFSVMLTASPQS